MTKKEKPFWQTKTLKEMTQQEWESLCDGCAKCCLHKLEDEDTGEVFYTEMVCRYLDRDTCHCTEYERRQELVPHCVWLTPDDVEEFHWLPSTCAYRLVHEGKPLPKWHHLRSGDRKTIHKFNHSMRNKGIPDDKIPENEWEDHIIWIE
ncbi:YcgN family cysteine cluster protein [Bermanella sp. R86510]|uniref:YcgN family cysteine cluster protein n=1 Tax=unclassified Bermanella TaxID=2627862 RepID=UPI0037C6A699